ncbi:MAG: PAS domain S-box protein [Candidatus Heimdallarchaeota archaeon]
MKDPLLILHLEDNKNDAELVKETMALKGIKFEIIQVDNKEDFMSNLLDKPFDIILADYNLPSFDGFSALNMVKKYAKEIPFIFISGVLGEDKAIETLKQGAVDYVIKSRLERLVPAINRALREKEERAERINLEREIVELEQMIGELQTVQDELTKRVRGFIKIEVPSGKYVIVDKFLEDISGYKISDWKTTPNFISEIIHPDFAEYYKNNIDQLKDGFVPKMLEYKIIHKNKDERWWLQFNIGAFDAEYQNLFENALTGMFRSDIQTGKIIDANEKIARILGCSSVDELKLFNANDFYLEKEKRKELTAQLMIDGFYEGVTLHLKKVDGTEIWVLESSRIYPEEGYIEGLLVDITDKKRTEDAIKRDRKAFQCIAEATVHAKTTEDLCQQILEGLIDALDFNAGSVRLFNEKDGLLFPIALFGINEDEKEQISPISIHDENHVGALVARTRKHIFAHDIQEDELLSGIKPQIKDMKVGSNITWPILSSEEKLLGILQLISHEKKDIIDEDKVIFSTIADLLASALEYKEAEDALRESEEKFRAFAEQSFIGVSLIDFDGNFIFINDQLQQIAEYSYEELSKSKATDIVQEFFTLQDIDRLKTQISDTQGTPPKPSQNEEYQITTRNNKIKWVSIRLTPIEINDQFATGLVVLDITEEKIAQQSLNRERQAFHILAEAIVNAQDIADLCQRILSGLVETLQFTIGTFRLFNKEDRILHPYAVFMTDKDRISEIKPLSIDDTSYLNTHVARTMEPVFAPDISVHETAKKYLSRLSNFGAQAIITWPIVNAKDELLGTIQIVADKVKAFTEADRFFFETVVRFFAAALEREWSKEALEESKEQYRRLIETSPFGIINTDLSNTILMVNQRSYRFFGQVNEDEIIGTNMLNYVIESERESFAKDLAETSKLGIIRNVEYTLVNSSGTTFPVELSFSVILNDEDNPEGYIIIGQNIAERKQRAELQSRLSNIVTHGSQVVISSDTKGIIVYTNPAVENVFGYKPSELIGKHISMLSPHGHHETQDSIFKEIFTSEKLTVETTRKHKDGRIIPVIMTLSPVKNDEGEVITINGMLLDVSEIKALEASLKTRYHEFEVLNRVISVGYRAKNISELYEFSLDLVLKSLDFSGGAITLNDPTNVSTEIPHSMGVSKQFLKFLGQINSSSPEFKTMFRSNVPVILEQFQSDVPTHESFNVGSFVSVPFLTKEKNIGSLILISKHEKTISEEDIRILEAIGREIGTAIAKFKAEEDYKERQLVFQAIFDVLDDLILLADIKTGLILRVNKTVLDTLGYKEKALLKMTISDLHTKDATKANKAMLEKVIKGKLTDFQMVLQTSSNKKLSCKAKTNPLLYRNRESLIYIIKPLDD